MRTLARNEMLQRGCEFCLDHRANGREGTGCVHAVCPYHELDNVKTYREYEKSLKGEDIIRRYVKKFAKCQKNVVFVRKMGLMSDERMNIIIVGKSPEST